MLDSARLGAARLGSARLGAARLGSARLGWKGRGGSAGGGWHPKLNLRRNQHGRALLDNGLPACHHWKAVTRARACGGEGGRTETWEGGRRAPRAGPVSPWATPSRLGNPRGDVDRAPRRGREPSPCLVPYTRQLHMPRLCRQVGSVVFVIAVLLATSGIRIADAVDLTGAWECSALTTVH